MITPPTDSSQPHETPAAAVGETVPLYYRRKLLWAVPAVTALTSLSACSGVATLNALSSRPGAPPVREGVSYGDDPRQKLDIYPPEGEKPAGGWPAVVFFYGGSWNMGERADYRFVGHALASRGILTVVADYRLYPQVRYPAFLQDTARATAWFLKEAPGLGADPKRLFLMGHSAGAYNASMVALDPRWLSEAGASPKQLAGWVGLAGPYDFYPIGNPDVQPVFEYPNYPPKSQPGPLATGRAPRTFLGAAINDRLVDPQRNTVELANRLERLRVPVELHLYERVNHPLLIGAFAPPLRFLAPVFDDVTGFLTRG